MRSNFKEFENVNKITEKRGVDHLNSAYAELRSEKTHRVSKHQGNPYKKKSPKRNIPAFTYTVQHYNDRGGPPDDLNTSKFAN